jgi:hypothetical protein
MAQHETAGEFMGLMFMSRDMAHREHLKTRSYAVHKALGKFYPDIIDLSRGLRQVAFNPFAQCH